MKNIFPVAVGSAIIIALASRIPQLALSPETGLFFSWLILCVSSALTNRPFLWFVLCVAPLAMATRDWLNGMGNNEFGWYPDWTILYFYSAAAIAMTGSFLMIKWVIRALIARNLRIVAPELIER